MRDAAAVRRWLGTLALLEDLAPADLDLLAAHMAWVRLEAGDRLHAADERGTALWFLVDGAVVLGPDVRAGPDGVVRREIATPGYPVGWDGIVWPHRHRWHATARTATRVLRVPRAVLDAHMEDDPALADRMSALLLWLAGEQVRRQCTRLVTRRYDDEIDAVAALIADRADELRVTSTLHRVPAYLRARATVADAFRALEVIRDGDDAVEAQLARQALSLLAGVRRELRVYVGMQRVYEAVVSAPRDEPDEVRGLSCRAMLDLFAETAHRIVGLEHLPARPGNVVVCNHLRSHPDNRLPNGFSLILDTHFVSSMILYRTYGRPPVRVVRDSHWHEAGHERYYAPLGYIMVPSSEDGPLPAEVREQRRRRFLAEAGAVLRDGRDLVVCPEGATGPTAGSPGRLRPGAFLLTGALDPEPWIVPVAVANFDQRLSRAVLGAVVAEPFRMSDVVDDPCDRAQVTRFLNDELTPRYRAWVRQAASLGSPAD